MFRIEVTQLIRAPRERVFDVLTDLPGWTGWAGLGRVTLEREGQSEACGPGAIRLFGNARSGTREEIVSLDRPASTSYRVLSSGLPIHDHLGEVFCAEDGDATLVTWRARFDTDVPGLGPVLRVVIKLVFARTLRRLARKLDR